MKAIGQFRDDGKKLLSIRPSCRDGDGDDGQDVERNAVRVGQGCLRMMNRWIACMALVVLLATAGWFAMVIDLEGLTYSRHGELPDRR